MQRLIIACFVASAGFAGVGVATPVAQQQPARTVALVFDDLPFVDVSVNKEGALANAQIGTAELLRVLREYGAPAFGFVNQAQLDTPEREARTALLRAWTDAGIAIGNAGSPVAPNTIDSSDAIFNAVLMRARDFDDPVMVRRTLLAYADFVMTAAEFAERSAREKFGRDVPQVLRLRANDINTDVLEELLIRFERRGYKFVSLEAALQDAAYRSKESTPAGVASGGPQPPQWVLDYYRGR